MLGMYQPHDPVRLDASKGGRTKQSFSEESNINNIMKKYEKTGMLDHLNKYEGQYGDFIAAPDYHTAMNAIRDAGDLFMEIPATIRAKFENDPAQFLAFVQDKDNIDEMRKMGLARGPNITEPDLPPEAPGPVPEPTGDPTSPVDSPTTPPAS